MITLGGYRCNFAEKSRFWLLLLSEPTRGVRSVVSGREETAIQCAPLGMTFRTTVKRTCFEGLAAKGRLQAFRRGRNLTMNRVNRGSER